MGAIHRIEEGREAIMRNCERSSQKVSDMEIFSSLEEMIRSLNMDETRLRLGEDLNDLIKC